MHFLFLSDHFLSVLLGIYYWGGAKDIRPPHIHRAQGRQFWGDEGEGPPTYGVGGDEYIIVPPHF